MTLCRSRLGICDAEKFIGVGIVALHKQHGIGSRRSYGKAHKSGVARGICRFLLGAEIYILVEY